MSPDDQQQASPTYKPWPRPSVFVSLSRTEQGWRLSAEVDRSSVNTGGAQKPAEIRRLLRNLVPELFANLPLEDPAGPD